MLAAMAVTIQDSGTTADLRGIHALGGGVAWASGTHGTVLRTVDDGRTWTKCTVPAGAEALDFRGIQAFDRNTAIAMSSGKGDLSRLYKTTDGCATWRLVLTNPDPEGFWDAIQAGFVVGDPVGGEFPLFVTTDRGDTWRRLDRGIAAESGQQSLFAASNSCLLVDRRNGERYLVTGGGVSSLLNSGSRQDAHMAVGQAAGGFSLASRMDGRKLVIVAVGGDYKKPDDRSGTVATWRDGRYRASRTLPLGYRSAVAWDAAGKRWIAVGPNGVDVSTDDGINWRALPEAGANWNAVSLPFLVGPHGRIGRE